MKNKPVIILVGTQLSHNIGSSARAMLNFGLHEMRLVAPALGDKWYDQHAISMSAGATNVLDGVQVFATLKEAIADLNLVFATSNRRRYMNKDIMDARHGATELGDAVAQDMATGIVFGCEKSGLDNDDISLCDKVIEIPVNQDFGSLNLSQAVLVIAYEWYQQVINRRPEQQLNIMKCTRRANKKEFNSLVDHLVRRIDDVGFLSIPEKRDIVIRKINNIFSRAQLMEQETRLLHGIVAAFTGEGKYALDLEVSDLNGDDEGKN